MMKKKPRSLVVTYTTSKTSDSTKFAGVRPQQILLLIIDLAIEVVQQSIELHID